MIGGRKVPPTSVSLKVTVMTKNLFKSPRLRKESTATKGRVIGPKSNLRMENLNAVDQGKGSGNSTPQFTFLYPLIS